MSPDRTKLLRKLGRENYLAGVRSAFTDVIEITRMLARYSDGPRDNFHHGLDAVQDFAQKRLDALTQDPNKPRTWENGSRSRGGA